MRFGNFRGALFQSPTGIELFRNTGPSLSCGSSPTGFSPLRGLSCSGTPRRRRRGYRALVTFQSPTGIELFRNLVAGGDLADAQDLFQSPTGIELFRNLLLQKGESSVRWTF